ncbi:MAG: hypothetical protein HC771_02680 [Synechococcales cyanobacterium CRU_2_2]|nr:hypothetical protein [Synechococcales cyanobacterium CRU_2_2]
MPLPGTDLAVLDTIADQFDASETLERNDLLGQAIAAIHELDQHYLARGYLKLWQGQVQGKKQTQLATDLGITQGEVSKRWRELVARIADMLSKKSGAAGFRYEPGDNGFAKAGRTTVRSYCKHPVNQQRPSNLQ